MELKKALKNLLFFGSAYYTVITAVLLIVASSMSDGQAVRLIEVDQFLKILLFSFIMSVGSTLYRADLIPRVAAACLHAVCYIGGWALFIAICGGNFSVTAISTAVFAVLYAAITFVCRKICKRSKKAPAQSPKTPERKPTSKAKNDYSSQFR